MVAGEVGFHDEKAVQKMKVPTRNGPLLRKLEKTKEERNPDLRQEREDHDAELKRIVRYDSDFTFDCVCVCFLICCAFFVDICSAYVYSYRLTPLSRPITRRKSVYELNSRARRSSKPRRWSRPHSASIATYSQTTKRKLRTKICGTSRLHNSKRIFGFVSLDSFVEFC